MQSFVAKTTYFRFSALSHRLWYRFHHHDNVNNYTKGRQLFIANIQSSTPLGGIKVHCSLWEYYINITIVQSYTGYKYIGEEIVRKVN